MAHAATDCHPPWTTDDLARFPAGWQVEILDGTLVVDHNPETHGPWTNAASPGPRRSSPPRPPSS
ncbi:hypothetical protein [Nocardioides ginsengisoli]|uniref:hypothetical protein n=1 Tax=Nocardioides ginsengisoli TaxID=363868 RepID=UPI0036D23AA2